MERKDYAIIAGLVVGVIIINLTMWLLDKDPWPLNSFIIPAVMIMLFVISQRSKKRQELHSDVRKHTLDIQRIYHMLTDVEISEERQKFTLMFPERYRLNIDYDLLEQKVVGEVDPSVGQISEERLHNYNDYKYYEFALEHLKHKKYKNIYNHWHTIKKLRDKLNTRPSFQTKLRETINKKIHKELPELDLRSWESESNHYDSERIFEFVFNAFIQFGHSSVRSLEVTTHTSKNKKWIIPKGGNYPHIIIDDTNVTCFDRYKKLCEDILDDTDLRKYLDDELEIIKKTWAEIRQFAEKLRVLATRLEAGEMIEGKCQIGY